MTPARYILCPSKNDSGRVQVNSRIGLLVSAFALVLLVPTQSLMAQDVNSEMHTDFKSNSEQQEQSFELNIPVQELSLALNELSVATRSQISASSEVLKGEMSQPLKGSYTVLKAIQEITKDSGLNITKVGNNSYTLTLPKGEPQPSVAPIETVTIMGSYTAQSMNSAIGLDLSLRETPQSVSIITRQMIEDKGLTKMSELLKYTPGVSMTGDASEDYLIYVRGFDMDASVQVDGMISTIANLGYSGSITQCIDPVIAERVEVLKGAAGILSGLGEPSATVNMTRKRPTEDFQANIFGSIGTWSTIRTEADVSGPLNESGSIRGRFVGALQDNESFLDRYAHDKSVIYGVIEMDVSTSTVISLAIDNIQSNTEGNYNYNSNPAYYTDGTPIELDRSFSTGQTWSYRDVEESSVMPEIEHTFDSGWFVKASYRHSDATIDVLNGSFGDNVDKATGEFVPTSWREEREALHSDRTSVTDSFNMYTTGNFSLFGRVNEFILGYSAQENEFELLSTYYDTLTPTLDSVEVPAPDLASPVDHRGQIETQFQTGFYTTARLSLADKTKLMIGGRLSSWEYEFEDAETGEVDTSADESSILTPYVGLVYDFSNTGSAYISYTGIFLPNTLYGSDGALLDPTEGTNTELGIKFAFFDDELNVSAAIYQSNKDNSPEYANMGQLPNGKWVYRSEDGIKTDGYEVEISGALSENWSMSGGYTSNTSEDSEGEKRQAYIPDDTVMLTTSYDMSEYISGLTIGGSIRWQSKTYGEGSVWVVEPPIDFVQTQEAYFLVDLMARYNITDDLTAGINIDNLMDEEYQRSLWGFTDYGKPRSIRASLRFSF